MMERPQWVDGTPTPEGAEVDGTYAAGLTTTNYCLRGLQPLRQDPWHRSEGLHRSPGPGPPGPTIDP